MPITWDDFLLQKLKQIIQDTGLDIQPLNINTATKAQLVQWLNGTGLEPKEFCGQTVNNFNVHQPAPKLDLPQGSHESIVTYLQRFELALELNNIANDKKVPLLHQNLQPAVAILLNDMAPQIRADFLLTKRELLKLFQVDKFHFLKLFESDRKLPTESFAGFAQRLKRHYADYCSTTVQDLEASPDKIDVLESLLLSRVIEAAPHPVQLSVKAYALGGRSFAEVVQELDKQVSVWKSTPRRLPTAGADIRQSTSHTSTQPSVTKQQPSRGGFGPCFKCGKLGHFARSCSEN